MHTPDGEGTVVEVNVVAGTLKVRSHVESLAPRVYKREECVYLRGGKRVPKTPRSGGPITKETVVSCGLHGEKRKIWHLRNFVRCVTLKITQ